VKNIGCCVIKKILKLYLLGEENPSLKN